MLSAVKSYNQWIVFFDGNTTINFRVLPLQSIISLRIIFFGIDIDCLTGTEAQMDALAASLQVALSHGVTQMTLDAIGNDSGVVYQFGLPSYA